MGRRVDLGARIAVVVPDAAWSVRPLEHDEIVELGFPQMVGGRDAAEPAAYDRDANVTSQRSSARQSSRHRQMEL